jgi:hypothetical protein
MRPSIVSAFAGRCEALATSRSRTTWAGDERSRSDAAMRTTCLARLEDRVVLEQAAEGAGHLRVADAPLSVTPENAGKAAQPDVRDLLPLLFAAALPVVGLLTVG